MAHTDPTSMPFDEALLSAYLDDELTAEERARVEAHLADNSAAGLLLDELGVLAHALQKLPQHRVDPEFCASVMAAIDRAALATPASVTRPEGRPDVAPRFSGWYRGRVRGWAWSAAAVATALLVMFLSGERLGHKEELAKVEEADRPAASVRPTERRDGASPLAGNDAAADARRLGTSAESGAIRLPARPGTAAPPLGAVLSADVSEPSVPAAREGEDGEDGDESAEASRAFTFFATNAENVLNRRTERFRGEAGTEELIDELERLAPPLESVPIVLVRLDLSPHALNTQALDTVLASNQIEFESARESPEPAVPRTAGVNEDPPKGGEARALTEKLTDEAAEDYRAIVVQATPEQIHAALKELSADRRNCLALDIQSNEQTREGQQQWFQYERRSAFGDAKRRAEPERKLASLDSPAVNQEKGTADTPELAAPSIDTLQVGRARHLRLGEGQRQHGDEGHADGDAGRDQVIADRVEGGFLQRGRGGLAGGGYGAYGGRGKLPVPEESPQPLADSSRPPAETFSVAGQQPPPSDQPSQLAAARPLEKRAAPHQVRAIFLLRISPEAEAAGDIHPPADAMEH